LFGPRVIGQTYSDRDSGLVIQILKLVDVTGQQRLFDEQGSMGLEELGKLFGHPLVNSPVEVARHQQVNELKIRDLQANI
jgi:hypothetical protein